MTELFVAVESRAGRFSGSDLDELKAGQNEGKEIRKKKKSLSFGIVAILCVLDWFRDENQCKKVQKQRSVNLYSQREPRFEQQAALDQTNQIPRSQANTVGHAKATIPNYQLSGALKQHILSSLLAMLTTLFPNLTQ